MKLWTLVLLEAAGRITYDEMETIQAEVASFHLPPASAPVTPASAPVTPATCRPWPDNIRAIRDTIARLPSAVRESIRAHIKAECWINAIKELRNATELPLVDAKAVIDVIRVLDIDAYKPSPL